MPEMAKKKWGQNQEPEDEDKDTSGGTESNGGPRKRGNRSDGSFNRPEPEMVFDMDDLERGQAGTNRPEEFPLGPAPEPELLEGQGWISDEPLFGATILKPMLGQTRMENTQWDGQSQT